MLSTPVSRQLGVRHKFWLSGLSGESIWPTYNVTLVINAGFTVQSLLSHVTQTTCGKYAPTLVTMVYGLSLSLL